MPWQLACGVWPRSGRGRRRVGLGPPPWRAGAAGQGRCDALGWLAAWRRGM